MNRSLTITDLAPLARYKTARGASKRFHAIVESLGFKADLLSPKESMGLGYHFGWSVRVRDTDGQPVFLGAAALVLTGSDRWHVEETHPGMLTFNEGEPSTFAHPPAVDTGEPAREVFTPPAPVAAPAPVDPAELARTQCNQFEEFYTTHGVAKYIGVMLARHFGAKVDDIHILNPKAAKEAKLGDDWCAVWDAGAEGWAERMAAGEWGTSARMATERWTSFAVGARALAFAYRPGWSARGYTAAGGGDHVVTAHTPPACPDAHPKQPVDAETPVVDASALT